MKVGVVLLAALASAATAAELCDFGELTVQLGDLVEPAFKCQTASGYSFVPPSTLPTAAQLTTICTMCADLIKAATQTGAALPKCALPFDNGSTVTVEAFFSGIAAQCDSGSAGSGSGAAPTTPIPTSPPTLKPAATPGLSTDSNSSSSDLPGTVSPPKTTTKPSGSTAPSAPAAGSDDATAGSTNFGSKRDDPSNEEEDENENRAASDSGSVEQQLSPSESSTSPAAAPPKAAAPRASTAQTSAAAGSTGVINMGARAAAAGAFVYVVAAQE